MLSKDSMYHVESHINNQEVDDLKVALWMILTNTSLVKCMDPTLKISMGTPKLGQGNNVPKLSQENQ